MSPAKCFWCQGSHKDLRDLWSVHTAKNKKMNYGQMMIQCFDYNAAEWKQSKSKEKICPSCVKRLKNAIHFKNKLFGDRENDSFLKEMDFVPNSLVEEDTEVVNMTESDAMITGLNTNDPFDMDTVSVKEENHSDNEDSTAAPIHNLAEILLMEVKDEKPSEEFLTEIEGAGNYTNGEVTSNSVNEFSITPDLQSINTGYVAFDQPEHLEAAHWEEYIEHNLPDHQKARNAQRCRERSNRLASKRTKLKMKPKRNSLHQSRAFYNTDELTTVLKYTNATPFTFVRRARGLSCVYCRLISGTSPVFVDGDVFRAHVRREHDAVRLGMVRHFTRVTSVNMCVDVTELQCTWCETALASWGAMLQHLRREHGTRALQSVARAVRPYAVPAARGAVRCALCPRVAATLLRLRNHTATHYRAPRKQHAGHYVCDHCSQVYTRKAHLARHLHRIAARNKPASYKCNYCDKHFEYTLQLQEHKYEEHLYLGFKCQNCHGRRTFGDVGAFFDHYSLYHNHGKDIRGPQKECIECKNKFNRENVYKVNDNGEENNICKDCFRYTRQTVFHDSGDVTGFKCHVCGLNHRTTAALDLHWTGVHKPEWLLTTGFEQLSLKPVTYYSLNSGDYVECNVCKLRLNLKCCYKLYDNDREEEVPICRLCFIATKQADYQNCVKVGYKCNFCGKKSKKREGIRRHCLRFHRSEWLKICGSMKREPRFRINNRNISHKPVISPIHSHNSNTDYSVTKKIIVKSRRGNYTKKQERLLSEHNYTVIKCDVCCYTGPMDSIRDHCRRNHDQGTEIKDNSECFKCNIKFSQKNLFKINGKGRGINLCDDCFLKTRQTEYENGVRVNLQCFKCHICGSKCNHRASLFKHYQRTHRSDWRAMRGMCVKRPRTRKQATEGSRATAVDEPAGTRKQATEGSRATAVDEPAGTRKQATEGSRATAVDEPAGTRKQATEGSRATAVDEPAGTRKQATEGSRATAVDEPAGTRKQATEGSRATAVDEPAGTRKRLKQESLAADAKRRRRNDGGVVHADCHNFQRTKGESSVFFNRAPDSKRQQITMLRVYTK